MLDKMLADDYKEPDFPYGIILKRNNRYSNEEWANYEYRHLQLFLDAVGKLKPENHHPALVKFLFPAEKLKMWCSNRGSFASDSSFTSPHQIQPTSSVPELHLNPSVTQTMEDPNAAFSNVI
eukprot:c14904_g1_i1.p1 GENE.c14904_g1_i1~~c14904_g1_i1.p1  ORF type:complete len:122 (+),score=36.39 c14904_g1_i1:41-406(+)